MITLIRLFPFITFLPTLLAASPPRLLAWNHDIAARKLALVSGKELTLIQDLSSLRRTAPVQIKATGPLLIRALDKETGTDGKPIEVVCQIPETMEKPLIVLLPDQNNPTGLRFLIVDDNPDGFHWGTYRFLNATSSC